MAGQSNKINRRTFLVSTSLAGGGLILGAPLFQSCKTETGAANAPHVIELPEEWININPYLEIGDNGVISIYTPNPEFGQNIKTSMPMIIAEELDADWKNVIVKQAPYHERDFGVQFTGGSRGIMTRWDGLRQVGASARHMLVAAASKEWEVPMDEITTDKSMLYHEASGLKASYGEFASAAAEIEVPETLELKDYKDFKIVGHSRKNVDGPDIVQGKVRFGIDYTVDDMVIAMIEHPPAFGMTLDSFDGDEALAMPGIIDVFSVSTYKDGFERAATDVNAFPEIVAIVGETTWQVLQAKKKLNITWKPFSTYKQTVLSWGGDKSTDTVPSGLESTTTHLSSMEELAAKSGKVVRKDGNPEAEFIKAANVIERTYSAPFMAHNCMEPINAFAHVQGDQVKIAAPVQGPVAIIPALEASLGIPRENIDFDVERMGGGFGRKIYAHYVVEAALISQKIQRPVKLVYTREDDMTQGVYRPTYQATYKAAINENNELTAIHIKAGGIPESPLFANRFPAGCIDHYLAEEWFIDSNITIGAFRAPRSNFMACAEQSFLDELAETLGKDPIDFRLELLNRAKENPVGERNEYDAERYAGVLELVRETSNWDENKSSKNLGVAAYLCHNSYAAQVLEVNMVDDQPVVENVHTAIDCGIVVNPDAATNMCEGGVVDAIGCALYGNLPFENGQPQRKNFDQYRMIRMPEAPKNINVSFVDNGIKPTGLGEPPYPPTFAALANAMYKASGKRFYKQPFMS